MCELLNSSDFEMHSRNQVLNFELLRKDLKRNDYLGNPILRMEDNIRLKMKGHPLLKMQTNIRLQLSRLSFLKNQLGPIYIKPP